MSSIAATTYMVRPLTKRGKVTTARLTANDWCNNAFATRADAEARKVNLESTMGRRYAVVEMHAQKAPPKVDLAKRSERELVDALMEKLGFDFPYARNWDRLDFKEVNVESLRDALVAAYRAGKEG